jgi:hypothetical protein
MSYFRKGNRRARLPKGHCGYRQGDKVQQQVQEKVRKRGAAHA